MIPLAAACGWVILATLTALLPRRHQIVPGLLLLVAAPVLLGMLALAHGWPWAVLGLLAVLSMFRRPLLALARHLSGATA